MAICRHAARDRQIPFLGWALDAYELWRFAEGPKASIEIRRKPFGPTSRSILVLLGVRAPADM